MTVKGLAGKKIGVAADRRADDIARLIGNMDGRSAGFPIQGSHQYNQETARRDVLHFLKKRFGYVLLTTGIGARTLEDAAAGIGHRRSFIKKLSDETLLIRGQKTADWLKEQNLAYEWMAEDGTMAKLLSYMEKDTGKSGKSVYLQAYNLDDAALKDSLEEMGYDVYLSKPYSFLPPDPVILGRLRSEITKENLDAVVFTSKTQVKQLFSKEQQPVIDAFNRSVLATAVGKVTAAALEEQGISYVLQPEKAKMGAMIVALERYYREGAHTAAHF
ncbi:uroporphyrinogen-III synthase [Halobacillus kuroshimensis]|uniref:uroporphyrinogen-III synthase n=1 Tax=Halobacillus kuroshimensis TaxID=302481 RepID=UPI0009FBFE28|nr:uroporphyrinogen-III synthase [Halobacillus kuroshimensis]